MLIGIDLGGTKTEIIALNGDNGKELYRHRVPTPKSYEDILNNMADMVRLAEKTVGEEGTVGIGIPGAICQIEKVVKNANTDVLNGKALDQDLGAKLNRSVKVTNDANCFAMSEATDGAGAGHNIVFGVIIGTGVGAGIVVRGHSLTGANAIAGEWGLNPLPWMTDEERADQPMRHCQRSGLMESYVSGPALKNDFNKATGKDLSTHDIIAAAEQGDQEAEAALQRYENRLARGLAYVINILDPDVIVLGGGMGNVNRLYTNIPKIWKENTWISSATLSTKLLPPRHGDSSGVRGAAWLWKESGVQTGALKCA